MNTNSLISIIYQNTVGNDSSWFWTMAQFLAVAVSLVFIYRQVKLQRMGNMLTVLGAFHERWESDKLIQSRIHVCEDYGKNETSISVAEEPVLVFFEELGLHLRKNVFDKETLWEVYSYEVQHYWQILSPRISAFRTDYGDPTWYSNFEYLFNAMKKHTHSRHLQLPETKADLEKFVRGELERSSPPTKT